MELPLCTQYDEKYFGAALHGAITDLKSKGYLSSDRNETSSIKMWNYIGPEVIYVQLGNFVLAFKSLANIR